ncbi:MAG TPA: DUF2695 domain-containing protein [Intrasporangium sp.]|uniref:DUF2695 domain-containing protein n=1 Tax=Intrasporangium sp. TaxID=1925024 RepID=UPI002D79D7CA|nr:DUF2695 domain-containing protein [Intrasporangium sp.]HET7397714.1 DUF2695 domain-containing protein [Intrasporangium sp.]
MSNVIDIRTKQPIGLDGRDAPGPGECLACFVHRMVADRGCTGVLGWVERWRSERARRATALAARLQRRGATCDCAVIGRVWSLSAALWEPDPTSGELLEPGVLPQCRGVRPNSTHPCEHWVDRHDLAL